MAGEIVNYADKANVRMEFYDTSTGEIGGTTSNVAKGKFHSLYGFLTDDGLDLSLTNNFKNALDFGILDQAKQLLAGARGLKQALTGTDVQGYMTGGIGGEIILNAPYYWQGTEPIQLTIPLYQIADNNNDILQNYQRVLEILSPNMGSKITGTVMEGGETESIQLAGSGPGLVYVHYFPSSKDGQGRMIFGPCLCQSISMRITPPYSFEYMPIVGIYNFKLQVSRILDRSQITYLFDKKFPSKTKG